MYLFRKQLIYRGNRTTKISANAFEAFASPNFLPLATAGIHINYQTVTYPFENDHLKLYTELDNRVALLKIFPGFNANVYKSLFDFQNIKGIVLETFGAGNAPTDKLFDDLIADYIEQGGVVLNITQCQSGSVEQGLYETSSFFQKIGVIGGGDMTTEAAICKLMFALGYSSNKIEIEKILRQSIAGELSMI